MAATDRRVSVAELRSAVAQGVSSTSLREVARQVGMSPTGLRNFLDGSEPYSTTRQKLERWFVRGEGGEVGEVPGTCQEEVFIRLMIRSP